MGGGTNVEGGLVHEKRLPERLALAGFLAGYTGLTREAYALDLRQFSTWCRQHDVRLFRAPPRRHPVLPPGSGSQGTGTGDGYPPAVHDRQAIPLRWWGRATGPLAGHPCPAARLDYESHPTGLTRNQVAALLAAAEAWLRGRACADLAARPNGLRASEATGTDSRRWIWNADTVP